MTGTSSAPLFACRDLSLDLGGREILRDIGFEIRPGEVLGIIGPNGAGKSTLIKAILGLVPLAGGEVSLFGKPIAKQRKRIGYVPQRESVDWDFPVSVTDAVLMGTYGDLGWFRRPGRKQKDRVRQCLQKVGIEQLASRQIGQLSGGQQQRVFLARALAQEADVYFMDEPMAGVDAATEDVIFRLLRELRDAGKTVLVVHHDLRTVPTYFDDVALLNMRLVAHGPVETVFTPENLRKTYGGRLNILETAGEAVRARERSE
jgi:manganese/zinc/iron transport system ATP- binding protein